MDNADTPAETATLGSRLDEVAELMTEILGLLEEGHGGPSLSEEKRHRLRSMLAFVRGGVGGSSAPPVKKKEKKHHRMHLLSPRSVLAPSRSRPKSMVIPSNLLSPASPSPAPPAEAAPLDRLQDPSLPAADRLSLLRSLAAQQRDSSSDSPSRSSSHGFSSAPPESLQSISPSQPQHSQPHQSPPLNSPPSMTGLCLGMETGLVTFLDLTASGLGPSMAAQLARLLGPSCGSSGQQRLGSLEVLILDHNPIGPAGTAALAQALAENSALGYLSLERTRMGPMGGASVAEALRRNTGLRVLSLGGNRLGWSVGSVAEALQSESSGLLVLGLEDNEPTAAAVEKLCAVLARNTSLLMLGFENNYLGPQGFAAVATALRHNGTLLSLSLDGCGGGFEGAVCVADALEHNKGLLALTLGHNAVGTAGAACIARGLRSNASLLLLALDGNGITHLIEFCHAVSAHPSLLQLLFQDNPFLHSDPDSLLALADALTQHAKTPLHVSRTVSSPLPVNSMLLGGPGCPLPSGFLGVLFPRSQFPLLSFSFL